MKTLLGIILLCVGGIIILAGIIPLLMKSPVSYESGMNATAVMIGWYIAAVLTLATGTFLIYLGVRLMKRKKIKI